MYYTPLLNISKGFVLFYWWQIIKLLDSDVSSKESCHKNSVWWKTRNRVSVENFSAPRCKYLPHPILYRSLHLDVNICHVFFSVVYFAMGSLFASFFYIHNDEHSTILSSYLVIMNLKNNPLLPDAVSRPGRKWNIRIRVATLWISLLGLRWSSYYGQDDQILIF